jgi:hypothetical protein
MSRLTEPLVAYTARAIKDLFHKGNWMVIADGQNEKTYCIGTFVSYELACRFAKEWNVESEKCNWSRFAVIGGSFSDPFRETQSWEDMFNVEREANERLNADNDKLRTALEKTLSELKNLKDAIIEMELEHHREMQDLERSVMRDMTEAHREGHEEGRREAKREFDIDMEAW